MTRVARRARTRSSFALGFVLALVGVAGLPSGGIAARPDPGGTRTSVIGHSVDGRPLLALERGDLDSPRKVLVVGCMHGNECAGKAVTSAFVSGARPIETDLWLVPDLNPDGYAAGTRQNARLVDLNRNFPWRWRPLKGVFDSGPRPFSEPETRAAAALIERIRPSLSIWFHQRLDVVDDSIGTVAIEREFARVARMRLAALAREPGSAVTWEAHCFPAGTHFVVELAAGTLGGRATRRLVDAVDAAAAQAPERRPPRAGACGR
jgi:protein MpaA